MALAVEDGQIQSEHQQNEDIKRDPYYCLVRHQHNLSPSVVGCRRAPFRATMSPVICFAFSIKQARGQTIESIELLRKALIRGMLQITAYLEKWILWYEVCRLSHCRCWIYYRAAQSQPKEGEKEEIGIHSAAKPQPKKKKKTMGTRMLQMKKRMTQIEKKKLGPRMARIAQGAGRMFHFGFWIGTETKKRMGISRGAGLRKAQPCR
ncbi:MAG: hypothetical protein HY801_16395 [Candidatus Lindowbacteria bacterium]|nr:hypothetical protein [Candidatus Lindowbacteria bacterium]